MGLFSFVSGLIGGGSEKKAVKKATKAQIDALNKAIAEQTRQFDLTRGDLAPAREALAPSIGGIEDLLGLHGNDKASASIDALKQSPMYQSLYNNGLESLLANASATGGLRGGNTQGALYEHGANTLSSVIADQLSRLGGLAGLGLGATESGAGFGQQIANAISSLFGQQGQARASGALAIGGINNPMWQSAGSFLDQAAAALMPGGGGFGSMFSGF